MQPGRTAPSASSPRLKLTPGHLRSTWPSTGSAGNKSSADSHTNTRSPLDSLTLLQKESRSPRRSCIRAPQDAMTCPLPISPRCPAFTSASPAVAERLQNSPLDQEAGSWRPCTTRGPAPTRNAREPGKSPRTSRSRERRQPRREFEQAERLDQVVICLRVQAAAPVTDVSRAVSISTGAQTPAARSGRHSSKRSEPASITSRTIAAQGFSVAIHRPPGPSAATSPACLLDGA